VEPMVEFQVRRQLAAPLRAAQLDQRARRSSGRPRCISRCRGLCEVGWQGIADRGRMGVCRPRRPRWCRVCLGRRVHSRWHSRWQAHGEHLAGSVPPPEPCHRRLRADLTGDGLSAERLQALRHDWQRLGMDQRLVVNQTRGRRAFAVSFEKGESHESARRSRRRSMRSAAARPAPSARCAAMPAANGARSTNSRAVKCSRTCRPTSMNSWSNSKVPGRASRAGPRPWARRMTAPYAAPQLSGRSLSPRPFFATTARRTRTEIFINGSRQPSSDLPPKPVAGATAPSALIITSSRPRTTERLFKGWRLRSSASFSSVSRVSMFKDHFD
jgi:hypothetical protein